MDIGTKFSLEDFLAYLFPGIVGTLGLYVLLLLTPLSSLLTTLPLDLATGVLLLALSYVIGVVLSGLAEIALEPKRQRMHLGWVRNKILIPGFEQEIISAFWTTFGKSEEGEAEWSSTHFFLCRSLVLEFMPGLAQTIQRQSSLRQLRMNLIPSITIWAIAGVMWGLRLIASVPAWGYALAIGSAIAWLLIVGTIVNRMNSNERREVREVLTAFLAGFKKGAFKEKKGSDAKA